MLQNLDGLPAAVRRLTDDQRPEVLASAVEFVLEGLHLNRRLNCERTPLGYRYAR
jgi:magnesium chelatase subunit I